MSDPHPGIATSSPTIRPTLVVLLAIVVVPLSLLFGLGLAFGDEVELGLVGRVLVVHALFVAPIVVGVQQRSWGIWMRITAALVCSGGMMAIVLPLAVSLPSGPFVIVVGALVVGVYAGGRAIAQASLSVPPASAMPPPPRPDLPGS